MMLFRMPDSKKVAILTDNEHNKLRIRLGDLASGNVKPKLAVNMKIALYCHKHGLDLLTVPLDEFSDDNERFRTFRNAEIPPFPDEPTKPCKAVETEKGVVLFSDNERGNNQLGQYLQYLSDHFYEKDFGIETLRLYELDIPMQEVPETVNRCMSNERTEQYNSGPDDPAPDNVYADKSILSYGNCTKTFDMRATGDNF